MIVIHYCQLVSDYIRVIRICHLFGTVMERTVGVEVLNDQSLFTDGILLENASPGPVEHNFPVKSLMKDCSTLQIKDD